MKKLVIGFVAMGLAQMSVAQDIPQKFLDEFGVMALAATGSQLCDNVGLNQSAFNAKGEKIRSDARADGMTDGQIEKMMTSLESNPNVLMGSMVAFGDRHGVSPNDVDGFCGAMVGERSQGTALGQLLQ